MRVRSLGWEKSPGEESGNSFQYSCLENSTDGGAWRGTVHGVRESRTRLSLYTHTHTHTYVLSYNVYHCVFLYYTVY